MNASYRLNTCKSRGSMRPATVLMATGARVSNAYPTWPRHVDSLAKVRIIRDIFFPLHKGKKKGENRSGMGMRSIR